MNKDNIKQILIQSILGGQQPLTHYAGVNQFRASLGIDPAQPLNDSDSAYSTVGSGLLRPSPSEKVSGTTLNAAPLWMRNNPKDANLYVYDALSSAYALTSAGVFSALSDAGTLSGTGNGSDYYDNYMYFMTGTDVTRYGPLNGTPGWVPNYWTSTLGKAALTNTTYPTTYKNLLRIPNHPTCRHSDGRLYFGDVSGNQGVIHYIRTTKTTVEGDTNNGSTASALTFGYGLWPTCIESYNDYIAVGLIEVSLQSKKDSVAKFSLWDTTSSTFNKICWKEFPDQLITAIKNANGVLYVFSGNFNGQGFRVSRYLGGNSFKEVFYSETGEPPLQGAVEADGNRLVFGTWTLIPAADGCLYSVGAQKASIGNGIFNIMRATGGNSSTCVTAVAFFNNTPSVPLEFGFNTPTIGWTKGSGTANNGIDQQGHTYNNAQSVWWSETYKVGQPFNIRRIHIPLAQPLAANMTITPKIYYDNGNKSQTLTAINTTNFTTGQISIPIDIDNSGSNEGRGQTNFWLELIWSGSALCVIEFPITIEVEIFPD